MDPVDPNMERFFIALKHRRLRALVLKNKLKTGKKTAGYPVNTYSLKKYATGAANNKASIRSRMPP
jgi:hypothetical protein